MHTRVVVADSMNEARAYRSQTGAEGGECGEGEGLKGGGEVGGEAGGVSGGGTSGGDEARLTHAVRPAKLLVMTPAELTLM